MQAVVKHAAANAEQVPLLAISNAQNAMEQENSRNVKEEEAFHNMIQLAEDITIEFVQNAKDQKNAVFVEDGERLNVKTVAMATLLALNVEAKEKLELDNFAVCQEKRKITCAINRR